VGFFGRRKSIPRLDELLPEEDREIETLVGDSQTIPLEDDLEDIDTGLLIELYEEAVRKEPHEFIYHYILGLTYFSLAELEKAREIWEKASSLKPDDSRPLYDLGVIYYGIWDARKEEQTGTTKEQGYKQVKEILSNNPSLPDYLRKSGEEIVDEFENKMRHLDYKGYKHMQDCYRKSPISRESAKTNALYYFLQDARMSTT